VDPFVLFAGALFLGAAALILLIVDAVTTSIEARMVRDDQDPDAITRTRLRDTFWTLAVTATLAVLVAFAVDAAGQLIWEDGETGAGVLVLIGSAVAAFAIGFVAVFAILRRERPSYARLRRDLRDRSIPAIDPEELAEFDARLARADELAARRPRAAVALRVIALVVIVATGILATVTFAVGDAPLLAVLMTVLVLAGVIAFVVAGRAAATRQAKIDRVLATQRAEVAALLERARIPQRGRVPGLRDRVARALAILREKQR
jgi:uncharacterized membrane protein